MRRPAMAALACILGALAPLPGKATGIALNHEPLPPGTTLAACIEHGRAAIVAAGLRFLRTTPNAAWGEGIAPQGQASDTLYTIYCTPDGRFAFVVGAADRYAQVDGTVSALMTALRASTRGGVVQGAPGGQRK
ncbi:hypothetical protein [Falsiroseomonas sp. CW058]|uniref:hypothetical protein n=1 Tax=Falsiroseomonas sp. CW058 TaxID=3388664 RepID=UPI003D310643